MKKGTKNSKEIRDTKVIDATGKTLGRVASAAAMSLSGKDRVTFERHRYSGVPVKVINAGQIRITPKKLASIYHTRYSGMPGGLRILSGTETAEKKGMRE